MSRALARDERIPLDAYYTPDDVAEKCVATLKLRAGETILEPSVGGGAFARAAKARGCQVTGLDIDPHAAGFSDCDWRGIGDFADYSLGGEFDWIIGNPPFNCAQEHIEHALALQPKYGVAFLLRLAFLEGQKRAAFWRDHPPWEVHVLSKRPSFTGGGTDSAAYGWFVWTSRGKPQPTLGWL